MKPQFCCDGGNGCCGNTTFECYEINYGIEMICCRCSKSMFYTLPANAVIQDKKELEK